MAVPVSVVNPASVAVMGLVFDMVFVLSRVVVVGFKATADGRWVSSLARAPWRVLEAPW